MATGYMKLMLPARLILMLWLNSRLRRGHNFYDGNKMERMEHILDFFLYVLTLLTFCIINVTN